MKNNKVQKAKKAKMASRADDSCRKVVLVEVRQSIGIATSHEADDIDLRKYILLIREEWFLILAVEAPRPGW